MTEKEAIEYLLGKYLVVGSPINPPQKECCQHNEVMDMAITALEEIQAYRAIGTVEEFKVLKENERNCKDCAGCTNWKCDCYNERAYAIDEFVEQLKDSLMHNYRHLLSVDADGFEWLTTDAVGTHIDEIAEQMKGGAV